MFNRSTLIAKSTTIAAFFAALYLTSNAASAASTSYIPPIGVTSGIQKDARSGRPDTANCLGYSSTAEWVEVASGVWELEFVGQFCPPIVMWTCYLPEPACVIEYAMLHTLAGKKYDAQSHTLKSVVIGPIGPNGTAILTAKGTTWNQVATLELPASSGESATAAAVDSKTQTTYVSVSNTLGSGRAAVLVYQGGATTPTSILTDPAAGPIAAGVAVDSDGNVFWAANDDNGNGFLDEFEAQSDKIRRFNVAFDGQAGDLDFDRKGNLLVATPGSSSITSYNRRMDPEHPVKITGAPASMSLDAKNANLYVVDSTNNLIDQYAYPSGTLISSNPPQQINGQTPIAEAVLAPQ